MLFVLLLHALAGGGILCTRRALGRWVWAIAAVPPIAALAWLAANFGPIVDGDPATASVEWVPSLGVDIDLRVDAFSALMILLVSGIGALVMGYAGSYFSPSGRTTRAAGLLVLFAGAMLGIVVSDNVLALFVFWELTSITSYLLIGIDDDEAPARAAAQQAFMITGFGGLVMLGGLVVLGQQAGTYQLSEIVAAPPSGTVVSVAVVLVLVGAFTKSAQYPFHSWLPGAMVAPTPISAYLHSAAMVKAGVYLVARLAPAFAAAGVWRPLVVGVGLVTMVAGGIRALRPVDLKQLLAFGTISQLGFLMVLFGIGQPKATAAGCAVILAHALFKAPLFMVVGIVDHETHTRDMRTIPVLGAGWTPTKVVAVVSAASMAAIPPLAGFVAKEQAYKALVAGSTGDRVVLGVVVAASVLTVVYSLRFVVALVRPASTDRAAHAPAIAFVAPAAVLAGFTVVLGVLPASWTRLVDAAARSLDPSSSADLRLWYGVDAALVLSIVTIALGVAVFAWRRRPAVVLQRLPTVPSAGRVYDGIVAGVLDGAARVTSVVQSGSLPVYAAVVLATAATAPVVALVLGDWWSSWPPFAQRVANLPILALLVVAAFATARARRRFVAAIMLGLVGYAMAMLFVVQGAPDLALTQFAVETLSIVVFLLVFRVLPDRFEDVVPAVRRVVRVAVATAVGVFVVLFALATSGARTAPVISDEMSQRALPDGDGRNVVNVILVDIRGLDTLGEITVLAAAAIGVVALARAGRTPRRRDVGPGVGPGVDASGAASRPPGEGAT